MDLHTSARGQYQHSDVMVFLGKMKTFAEGGMNISAMFSLHSNLEAFCEREVSIWIAGV